MYQPSGMVYMYIALNKISPMKETLSENQPEKAVKLLLMFQLDALALFGVIVITCKKQPII